MGALFIFAVLSPFLITALIVLGVFFEEKAPLWFIVCLLLLAGKIGGRKTMIVNGWEVPFNYRNLYNEVRNEQVADEQWVNQHLG